MRRGTGPYAHPHWTTPWAGYALTLMIVTGLRGGSAVGVDTLFLGVPAAVATAWATGRSPALTLAAWGCLLSGAVAIGVTR